MSRLTADTLHGIWAGMTLAWDEAYRFDEETYAKNIERMLAEKIHGIYTTGSTGEFYALEFGEFRRMVDIMVDLCGKAKMPLQIGCGADATGKAVKCLEYAAGTKAVGAAQVVIPYWMELTDREVLQFFKDLYRACPDLPLVHYNTHRSKRFLRGVDYLRVLEAAPNLIGVKFSGADSNFGELQEAIRLTPNLSYFVVEHLLVSGMMIGARGCYSSLVETNPAYILNMYDKARTGHWPDAVKMQRHISRFYIEMDAFIQGRGEGMSDPVGDKGLGVASGCLLGSQRCRPPYIGWNDETVEATREWLHKNYPEFVYARNGEQRLDSSRRRSRI